MTKRRIHTSALYCFDSVRKLGSVREASRQLHIASSAVSRQIQKLEDDLDVKLFERLPSGLKLTAAGESFARHAQFVLQDTERLYSEINAIKGVQKGHVEIATVEGPAVDLIPSVIQEFRHNYPNISLGVQVTSSTKIPQLIIQGDADIGIAFDISRNKDLQQLWVANYDIGAIVTPQHPLAEKKVVSLQECIDYPLIISKSELAIHQHLTELLPLISTTHQLIETNSVDLARKLAFTNLGIAFQTIIGIENELNADTLRHIPITSPNSRKSELGIYCRSNRALPIAAELFCQPLIASLNTQK